MNHNVQTKFKRSWGEWERKVSEDTVYFVIYKFEREQF